ncbi:MAG: hypothetical protein KA791_06080, partial [Flavobacteriales bacterium]|nr:hypothetical protein [Flavobacteriales bacterium]
MAQTWTLSAKASPYLDHLDTLITALAHSSIPADVRYAKGARILYLYQRGYQAKFRRDIPAALSLFERAIELGGVSGGNGRLHDATGILYRAVGEPDLAIREFTRGLSDIDPISNPQGVWAMHISMGGAYAEKGDHATAERWFAPCDTTVDGVHVMLLNERARALVLKGDTLGGLAMYQESVRVCNPAPDDWARVTPLTAIARLQLERHDPHAALDASDRCASIALRTGDEAGWCACVILGGQARLSLGDRRRAERDLRMALDTARYYGYVGLSRASGDDGSMVRAAELLKDLYLRDGRMREAVEMTAYWSGLKDTLNSKDGRMDVLRAEMRRRSLADSLELVRRAEEERCAYDGQLEVERERRQHLLTSLIGGAIVFGLIGFLLVKRLQQARRLARQEKDLHEKEVDDLLQQHEIKAMNAMFDGQEKERDRVARDLHDRVGSMLGNVKMQMEVLEEHIGTEHREREDQYQKVYGLLVDTVGEVRRISHDMVAGTLARFGLEKALEGLCDSG